MKTKDLTKMALCLALLSVSSYIAFSLPFTPTRVTAQTMMVNVIALVLTPKQVFTTILLYLVMGGLGLPVFSGGTSGLAVLMSPSGGFLIAFLVAAPIMSLMKQRAPKNFISYFLITVLIGMPILYVIGAWWMQIVTQMGWLAAVQAAVLPFIVGDLLKCVIASTLSLRLEGIKSSQPIFTKTYK